MSTPTVGELARFQRFIAEQIQQHGETISPEEVLDLWRNANPAPDDYDETVRALREALADVADGVQGIPLAEFDRQFREKQRAVGRLPS